MSQQEIARLVETLQDEPEMLSGLPDMEDVPALVAFGQRHGFEITDADVQDYLSGKGEDDELSDAQLGAVAGGKKKAEEPQIVYMAQGVGTGFAQTFTSTGGTI